MSEEIRRYTALEISSGKVRLVHGYTLEGMVYVLHNLETNVQALEGGLIVESDSLTAAIKGLISSANEALNIRIRDVVLALPPMSLNSFRESASTNTINLDNRVVQIDINNCISLIKKTKLEDQSSKIVDVIPYEYVLENGDCYRNAPLGKITQILKVNATIYTLNKSIVDSYVNAVESTGIKVKKTVVSPLASALYLEDCEQIRDNVDSYYLLNVGSHITSFSQVSNKNMIVNNACLKHGGDLITEHIVQKYGIQPKEAKLYKEKYGMDKDASFKVNIFNNVTLGDLSSTIKEIVEPLIVKIKKQITNWTSSENRYLPIVITGGGTKLKGFKELLEKEFQVPIIDVTPYSFGARNKSFQICLGMIKYADKYVQGEDIDDLSKTVITRNVNNREGRRSPSQSYNVNEEL